MNDIMKAKYMLEKEKASFTVVRGTLVHVSDKRGIEPVINIIDNYPDFLKGASVADKVTGKAAAMLLAKYGVKEIYSVTISEKAAEFLKSRNIPFTYEETVPCIMNREGTDSCPMEKCVADTDDENEAEEKIRERRQEILKR